MVNTSMENKRIEGSALVSDQIPQMWIRWVEVTEFQRDGEVFQGGSI